MKKKLGIISGSILCLAFLIKKVDFSILLKKVDIETVFYKSIIKKNDYKTTKVNYYEKTTYLNGIKKVSKYPDFSNHRIFSTKLEHTLYIAKDNEQFKTGMQAVKKKFEKNQKKVINELKLKNKLILSRDKDYLKIHKKKINELEDKMLLAHKYGDLELNKKYYGQLKKLTNPINFVIVRKDQPIKLLDDNEILQRQIKDIKEGRGKLFGYIWHHSEKKGILELICKDIHEKNPHKGGNFLWGQGIR